jgi:hypothetical protein
VAKEDFAARCGFIDRDKFFSETEILIIKNSLEQVAGISSDYDISKTQGIHELVNKIIDITVSQAQSKETEYEPETEGFEDDLEIDQ